MLDSGSSVEEALSTRASDGRARHAELMLKVARDRDKNAFAELYGHYGPLLKGFMMRQGETADLAEDIAQEAMVAVWHKAQTFVPERGNVSTWIFTIARNLRIDTRRRLGRVSFADISGMEFEDEGPASDDALAAHQEGRHLNTALRDLPDDQREILTLAFVDELSQSQIARKLGLPLGTVKSRMRLAYGKLMRALEDLR